MPRSTTIEPCCLPSGMVVECYQLAAGTRGQLEGLDPWPWGTAAHSVALANCRPRRIFSNIRQSWSFMEALQTSPKEPIGAGLGVLGGVQMLSGQGALSSPCSIRLTGWTLPQDIGTPPSNTQKAMVSRARVGPKPPALPYGF